MASNTPLVSVLMVAYNSSKFIRQAIDSVLRQTYKHFELIIIDDNSSDNSWDIISLYDDCRIKRFRNHENIREYPNRNKAIDLAAGEYIIFIDADDVIYPHGLEFMLQFAEEFSDCAMIISRPWDERVIFPAKVTARQFYCFEYLDRGAVGINFTKVLFKAQVLKSVDRFPDFVKFGDLYIQYLIALRHSSVLIADASTWWRRTPGQASEIYLNDYSQYLMHELWIKLEMLNHRDCPLTQDERETAAYNLYGNYLRFLLKSMAKMQFSSALRLLRKYQVPAKYLPALFRQQKRNYFNGFSGDNPFH